MTNQQLSDYIKQQLQQEKNKEEIKNELLEAGWQEADINQTLDISNSSQSSKPPSAPSFTSTGLQRLDPKAVWFFFLHSYSLFAFLFIAIGTLSTGIIFAGVVTLLVLVAHFIWAKLTYHFYLYELTDVGFRKELGVIFKQYVTIPYDRIQNVDIYRGILTRILGLSVLSIQTAGASATKGGAEGKLPAVSQETAEQLRDELIQRSRQTKNQGL